MRKLLLIISLFLYFTISLFSQERGYQSLTGLSLNTRGALTNVCYKDSTNTMTADTSFKFKSGTFGVALGTWTLKMRNDVGLLNWGSDRTYLQLAGTSFTEQFNIAVGNVTLLQLLAGSWDIKTSSTTRMYITSDSCQVKQKLMLVRDIDTSDFAGGATGSVTQTGQVCKVLITSPSVTALALGDLTVTNSYIRATSIVVVTVQYTATADLLANTISIGTFTVTDGSMHVIFTPTVVASTLNDNFWIHYTVH